MTVHAILGASSAARWMSCTGSPRLIARLTESGEVDPNKSSVYAEEGTAAHALAEHCLHKDVAPAGLIGGTMVYKDGDYTFDMAAELREVDFEVTEEMSDAVQLYLDTIAEEIRRLPNAERLVEVTVFPLAGYEGDSFGTADVCLWDPIESELTVMDFKYGAGVVVDAEHNAQTMFYGLGGLRRVVGESGANACEWVRLVIVQPRARHADGPVRTFKLRASELVEWGGTLRSAIEATKDPKAPLHAGSHCKWCPAQPLCPAQRALIVQQAQMDFAEPYVESDAGARLALMLPDPENGARLGEALDFLPLLDSWGKEVRGMAQRLLEHGRAVGDYKLVRKRANRRWSDEDSVAAEVLKVKGITKGDVYAAPKLLSPAQMEKLKKVGKKWVETHAIKPEGALTIAKGSDPREAVAPTLLTDFVETPEVPQVPAEATPQGVWSEIL